MLKVPISSETHGKIYDLFAKQDYPRFSKNRKEFLAEFGLQYMDNDYDFSPNAPYGFLIAQRAEDITAFLLKL